jgi:putative mRNA 3-end processing factor
MAVRGAKNRKAIDRGFVLSDHADWSDLETAIAETNAQKVYVTHGYTATYSRWLNEKGIEAAEVKTMYGQEEDSVEEETIIKT